MKKTEWGFDSAAYFITQAFPILMLLFDDSKPVILNSKLLLQV
jgi:hypothetical protein